jgi:hypothetical protein
MNLVLRQALKYKRIGFKAYGNAPFSSRTQKSMFELLLQAKARAL